MQLEYLKIFLSLMAVAALVCSAFKIMKEYERAVVFRLGKLLGTKGPGLIFLIPLVDRMQRIDLRLVSIDVPRQEIMTRDNVPVTVDAVVYFNIVDPARAIISIQNIYQSTFLIAQATLRSILGQVELDDLLSQQAKINQQLQQIIGATTGPWGITIPIVEIKEVTLPEEMKRAMAKQAETERERRALLIDAQGEYQAAKTLAKAGQILSDNPQSLQLRYLQTLRHISTQKSATILFPFPLDLVGPFTDGIKSFLHKEKQQTADSAAPGVTTGITPGVTMDIMPDIGEGIVPGISEEVPLHEEEEKERVSLPQEEMAAPSSSNESSSLKMSAQQLPKQPARQSTKQTASQQPPFQQPQSRPLTPALSPRGEGVERQPQQPATSNQQPGASNQQPAASNQVPVSSNQQPAASSQYPAASSQYPATSNQPPVSSNQQPAASSQYPAASSQYPATSNQPPPPQFSPQQMLLSQYQQEWRDGRLRPNSVQWLSTDRCQFSCAHCETTNKQVSQKELTASEIQKALDELAGLGCEFFSITGGEPLLRSDIFSISRHAHQLGMRVGLTTNGQATEENLKALEQARFDSVIITLDGFRNTQERLRGVDSFSISADGLSKGGLSGERSGGSDGFDGSDGFESSEGSSGSEGSYERGIRTIEFFHDLGAPSIVVSTTLLEENIMELPQLTEEVFRAGAHHLQLQPLLFQHGRPCRNSPELVKNAFRFVLEARRRGFSVEPAESFGYLGPLEPLVRAVPFFCGCGWSTFCISHEGDVLGCAVPELPGQLSGQRDGQEGGHEVGRKGSRKEGNIRTDSLKKIWEQKFTGFRRNLPDRLSESCQQCPHLQLCRGGCWLFRAQGLNPCFLPEAEQVYQEISYALYPQAVEGKSQVLPG
jgi:radical SAM protein with 4Fe4S-binding SPASM domain